ERAGLRGVRVDDVRGEADELAGQDAARDPVAPGMDPPPQPPDPDHVEAARAEGLRQVALAGLALAGEEPQLVTALHEQGVARERLARRPAEVQAGHDPGDAHRARFYQAAARANRRGPRRSCGPVPR